MIIDLFGAMILIAIVCIIATAFMQLIPNLPKQVPIIVWAFVAVLCLLILWQVLIGDGLGSLNVLDRPSRRD